LRFGSPPCGKPHAPHRARNRERTNEITEDEQRDGHK
jgi:hypothetical protein